MAGATTLVDRETLGLRLKLLRVRAGLSQEAIEAKTGIPTSTLSRWENGTGERYPDLERLAALAVLYGVELGELLAPDFDLRVLCKTADRTLVA